VGSYALASLTMQRPRLDLTSAVRLAELADCVIPFSVRVAGRLGLADALVDGPLALDELAAATATHAPSLRRVLRALATAGVFCEVALDRFSLSPLAEPLRSDHAGSMRDALPFVAEDIRAWSRYESAVRDGSWSRPAARHPARTSPEGARLAALADESVACDVRLACDLRLPDRLAAGPLPVDELAGGAGVHAPSLRRALRSLAACGILAEGEGGRFALAPLGQLLRSDHPLGLRELYTLLPGEALAWSALDHSVRTGESAFDAVNGRSLWEHLVAHPDEGARFVATQRAVTRLELRAAVAGIDWRALRTVADVGGGDGTLLAGLLVRFPQLRGVLFDLPYALTRAPEVLADAHVDDRCEVVPGSFFERVPQHCDAYIVKRVLYCWQDEPALRLLRSIRAAMRPDSRLFVLEPVSRPGVGFDVGTLLDVLLLTLTGAGARSPEQLAELFERAGLRLERIVSTPMLPIVIATPR
jgi:SAM-dependent methyltransferase